MPKKSKTTSKTATLVDVAAPGKTKPTPSARPIIVTNHPTVAHDPMVSDSSDPVGVPPLRSASPSGNVQHIKIIPPSEAEMAALEARAVPTDGSINIPGVPSLSASALKKTNQAAAAKVKKIDEVPEVADEIVDNPSKNKPSEGPDEVKTPDPVDAPKVETSGPSSPSPSEEHASVPDSIANTEEVQSVEDKKKSEESKRKEVAEKEAEQAEIDKVIASKQYFLPINSVEKRRDNRLAIVLLLLVVLLALVWLDVVLDAGVIHIAHLHALTHFFS